MPRALEPMRFGFLIAGTQKAATSSLSGLLNQHPQVQRAPLKEMHFFDVERRGWPHVDYSTYEVVPDDPRRRIVGDATPLYLWWPRAMVRIQRYNPDMKFIVVFRDPLERLFSQWSMVVNRWPDHAPTWSAFLTELAPDTLEDRIPEGTNPSTYRMRSGIVRGYYGAQLARGFEMFGRERFHLVEFRAFVGRPEPAVDAITDFLGLDRFVRQPRLPHALPGRPATTDDVPTGSDITGLVEVYRADFELFKQLSGLDVAHWPIQRLIDGRLDPAELADQFAAKLIQPARG
ncbi:sulfotransferase [Nocardioides sp. CN2-186]|uniref:sulfotransferase family protein n=1 Tax=Nocardioides tweenelious TaxID=3156607 RepID=UPI0032B37781